MPPKVLGFTQKDVSRIGRVVRAYESKINGVTTIENPGSWADTRRKPNFPMGSSYPFGIDFLNTAEGANIIMYGGTLQTKVPTYIPARRFVFATTIDTRFYHILYNDADITPAPDPVTRLRIVRAESATDFTSNTVNRVGTDLTKYAKFLTEVNALMVPYPSPTSNVLDALEAHEVGDWSKCVLMYTFAIRANVLELVQRHPFEAPSEYTDGYSVTIADDPDDVNGKQVVKLVNDVKQDEAETAFGSTTGHRIRFHGMTRDGGTGETGEHLLMNWQEVLFKGALKVAEWTPDGVSVTVSKLASPTLGISVDLVNQIVVANQTPETGDLVYTYRGGAYGWTLGAGTATILVKDSIVIDSGDSKYHLVNDMPAADNVAELAVAGTDESIIRFYGLCKDASFGVDYITNDIEDNVLGWHNLLFTGGLGYHFSAAVTNGIVVMLTDALAEAREQTYGDIVYTKRADGTYGWTTPATGNATVVLPTFSVLENGSVDITETPANGETPKDYEFKLRGDNTSAEIAAMVTDTEHMFGFYGYGDAVAPRTWYGFKTTNGVALDVAGDGYIVSLSEELTSEAFIAAATKKIYCAIPVVDNVTSGFIDLDDVAEFFSLAGECSIAKTLVGTAPNEYYRYALVNDKTDTELLSVAPLLTAIDESVVISAYTATQYSTGAITRGWDTWRFNPMFILSTVGAVPNAYQQVQLDLTGSPLYADDVTTAGHTALGLRTDTTLIVAEQAGHPTLSVNYGDGMTEDTDGTITLKLDSLFFACDVNGNLTLNTQADPPGVSYGFLQRVYDSATSTWSIKWGVPTSNIPIACAADFSMRADGTSSGGTPANITYANADHVHPANVNTAVPPAIGISGSNGSGTVYARSNHTHAGVQLASTTPAALDGSAYIGMGTTAAKSDHKHAISFPSVPTPATTVPKADGGTVAVPRIAGYIGDLSTYAKADHIHPLQVYDTTLPADIAGEPSAGTAYEYARRDHVHKGAALATTGTPETVALANELGAGTTAAPITHTHADRIPVDPGVGTYVSLVTTEGAAAANGTSWGALSTGQGVKVTQVTRVRYNEGDPTPVITVYYRDWFFDKTGRLSSISTEGSYTVAQPVKVTLSFT